MPNDWMIDFFVLGEGDPAPCNCNDRCQMSESLQRQEADGSGNKRYKIQRYRHPRTLARTMDNPECTLPDKRISLNHTTPGGNRARRGANHHAPFSSSHRGYSSFSVPPRLLRCDTEYWGSRHEDRIDMIYRQSFAPGLANSGKC